MSIIIPDCALAVIPAPPDHTDSLERRQLARIDAIRAGAPVVLASPVHPTPTPAALACQSYCSNHAGDQSDPAWQICQGPTVDTGRADTSISYSHPHPAFPDDEPRPIVFVGVDSGFGLESVTFILAEDELEPFALALLAQLALLRGKPGKFEALRQRAEDFPEVGPDMLSQVAGRILAATGDTDANNAIHADLIATYGTDLGNALWRDAVAEAEVLEAPVQQVFLAVAA